MKCIAIDDEPLALSQLSKYISRVPFLTLLRACPSASEVVPLVMSGQVDLIFTDITMPDFSGIDFVRSLHHPPMVIFTTAYPEYAVEGFRLEAVDYLLKPFDFQDLLRAAERARRIYISKRFEAGKNDTLFIKSDGRLVSIEVKRICYIESMSEYVRIHLEKQDEPVVALGSLTKLEGALPAHFMRVHRSYIVNLHKIVGVSRQRIIMDRKVYIPVGENYRESFNDYITRRCIL